MKRVVTNSELQHSERTIAIPLHKAYMLECLYTMADNGLSSEGLLEFTALIHLGHDVRTTDKFTLDVQLRNGWPVGIILNALANRLVLQHIHGKQVRHAERVQNADCICRKSALRKLRVAFHIQHHSVRGDLFVDAFLRISSHGYYLN